MKEIIQYEDFAKVEIKIGTIRTVEIVEDADKLLRLEVDFGEGKPRQILSAIRQYFENPHMLEGKQFPFVTNLAPRTIRGLVSEGMILISAPREDALVPLEPSIPVPPGTHVA